MAAEIPVLHPVHQAVGNGVQLLRRALLRDVVAAVGEGGIERRDRVGVVRAQAGAERRVGGIVPIHAEFPHVHGIDRTDAPGVVVHHGEVIGRSLRRQRAVEIGRQHAAVIGVDRGQIEILVGGRRIADQHLGAVEREHARAGPAGGVELVVRHVVPVRPDAEMGIVVHLVVRHDEIVEIPRPRGIARLRNRDHLVARRRADDELAQEPAVGQVVVEHDRIAVVRRRRRGGESGGGEKFAHQHGGDERGARRLVVDAEVHVDHGDIVLGPDVPVVVRGQHAVQVSRPFERDQRRRHGARHGRFLQRRIGRGGQRTLARRRFRAGNPPQEDFTRRGLGARFRLRSGLDLPQRRHDGHPLRPADARRRLPETEGCPGQDQNTRPTSPIPNAHGNSP